MKVFKTYSFKEVFVDLAIALLTIATFPFMIFCLIIRPIIYKQIYDATSHNTDYDFGSKKKPQPKEKDASHPSHNQ